MRQTAHPSAARGRICFTWDDGYTSAYRIAQLANARRQRHTMFITTGLVGAPNRVTRPQITDMWRDGHEIASHNVNHTDMTALTTVTRQPEWDTSKAYLEAATAPGEITSYAYPFGGRTLATDAEGYGRYQRIAGIGLSQGYNRPPWIYRQGSAPFLIGRFPWSDTTHAQLLALIRMAATQPVILTIYAHDPDTAGNPTMAQIIEAMDLVDQLGMPAITLDEAFPGAGINSMLANPGFEDLVDPSGNLPGWTKFPTAATVIERLVEAPDAGLLGSASLHITVPGAAAATASESVMQVFPVECGKVYTLGVRARVANLTGAGKFSIRRNLYDATGTALAAQSITGPAIVSTTWATSTLVVDLRAVGTEGAATCRFDLWANQVAGDFYVDHCWAGETIAGGPYS